MRATRLACVAALNVISLNLGCQQSAKQTPERDSAPGVQVLPAATTGEVAPAVKAELDRARRQSRQLLVYVSAEWCEPCRYFEQAAKRGDLEDTFPTLSLYKFDFDRDEDRLGAAGYVTDMIPLFVVPAADGTATNRTVMGSIKGPLAVEDNLVPRLRELLSL